MAGEQNVEIVLTADSRSVEAAQDKILRNLDIMADKLQKVEAKSKQSTKATEDGLSAAGAQAVKFVASITGIGSAVGGIMAVANQLRREYDNLVSRQRQAAGTQMGFETQLSEAVRNAAGLLSGGEMRDQALRIAKATSADPAAVAAALSSTLSAVGPTNKQEAQQAFAATEAAMKFAPEMGGADIAALAGTAVDISKRTGATTEQAIGFLQNIGGVPRVPSLQYLSSNVAPAVMGVTQFGGDIRDSAALVSALTQGMSDTEGRVSGTAALALAEQLRERFPKLGSTRERIDAVAADPKLFRAFLQGGSFGGKKFEAASFEKKALPSIEQILTSGSMLNRAFTEGADKIGDVQGAGQKTFDDLMREVNAVTFTSRLRRTFTSATQQQQIFDTVGGQTAVTREGLSEFLKSVGQSDLSQQINSVLFEGQTLGGSAPVGVAAQRLRGLAGSIRNPSRVTDGGGNMGFAPNTQFAAPQLTESQQRTAQALESLAAQLESFTKEIRQNTEATKENTSVTPKPVQTPRPVPSAGLSR